MTAAPTPIACTLIPGDFKERLAWIAELNRDALLTQKQNDLTLELTYDAAAIDRVLELVRREKQCCAFLTFDVFEGDDSIRLMIEAPADARETAASLFEPFLAEAAGPSACGCVPARAAHLGERRVAIGATAATAAGVFACAVCCALPFALPAAMVAGAGGIIAWFAEAQIWLNALGAVAVAAAWAWIGWHSIARKKKPAKPILYVMGLATILLGIAIVWPIIEARVIC